MTIGITTFEKSDVADRQTKREMGGSCEVLEDFPSCPSLCANKGMYIGRYACTGMFMRGSGRWEETAHQSTKMALRGLPKLIKQYGLRAGV